MKSLAPISRKLEILIPRLDSDQDGEVVATARAIGVQLRKAGFDWHDMALAATNATEQPDAGRDRRNDPAERSDDTAQTMVECLLRQIDVLRSKEAVFVRDLWQRSRRAPLRLTPRQVAWLSSIFRRVCGDDE